MLENENEYKQADMDAKSSDHVFSHLNKGQKTALAVLAFFAFIVLIFGIMNIRSGIYGPFQPKTSVKNDTVANTCADGSCNDISADQLKNKDTDNDGLSDYDEINFYKTSPYLEDSDGDGYSDKEEIENNKDPNCPVGRDCDTNVLLNAEADLTNPGVANNIDLEELEALNQSKLNSTSTQSEISLSDIDAPTLRQMLLEAGMEKALLDQISDQDLLATFQETLAEENQ